VGFELNPDSFFSLPDDKEKQADAVLLLKTRCLSSYLPKFLTYMHTSVNHNLLIIL